MINPRERREGGMALMLSILLLITVSALALSTMRTAASDGVVAGFQNQEQVAFYAAEAGIADARRVVRGMGDRDQRPTYPADYPNVGAPTQMSTTLDFQQGQRPRYYADPSVVEPITYIGEGKQCTEGCNMTIGGLKLSHSKWQLNVVGESPSGDSKRVEVVATRLLSKGY